MRRGITALLLSALGLVSQNLAAQVTAERLLAAAREPHNWLTYSGNYASTRYSELTQIGPRNVANLELAWVFQAQSLEKFETTPLVVDGVMYLTEAPNTVVALDPKTGSAFWRYVHTPSAESRPCCGRVNRGLAILGDTLYMATIDAEAHRARRGDRASRVGRVAVADASEGYAMTLAPLDDQRQGDRRRCGRRVRHPRVHRGLRRPTPARRSGASTRSQAPASPATRLGRAAVTRGRTVAHRCGSRARTIPSST